LIAGECKPRPCRIVIHASHNKLSIRLSDEPLATRVVVAKNRDGYPNGGAIGRESRDFKTRFSGVIALVVPRDSECTARQEPEVSEEISARRSQNRDSPVTERRIEHSVREVLNRREITFHPGSIDRPAYEDSAVGANRERVRGVASDFITERGLHDPVRAKRLVGCSVVE